jgi:formate hydrogenlyase transcriptional activator
MLARHFTQRFARRMGKRIESIPAAVMESLVGYSWPGNIRELQNVIERAVILSPGPALHVSTADLKVPRRESMISNHRSPPGNGQVPSEAQTLASPSTLADAEREHILRALRDTDWVLGGPNGAATRLAMKRTTLQSKMKKLGIFRPD